MVRMPRTCFSIALLASSWGRRSAAFQIASTTTLSLFQTSQQQQRLGMSSSDSATKPSSSVVASNLEAVRQNIQQACTTHGRNSNEVRLVAVSKTKPSSLLLEAYTRANHRVFGENYVQELVEKAAELPKDISWHFIGPLQSNKAALLVKSVDQLTVETVATTKLANKLNKAMEDLDNTSKRLNVFIQVNTSGEESKSGVECSSSKVVELIRHIQTNCPRLVVKGLMTIGAPNDLTCFDTLRECRDATEKELDLKQQLELSMGMSGDYVEAIARGSTNVRVGSIIFGERDYSNKK